MARGSRYRINGQLIGPGVIEQLNYIDQAKAKLHVEGVVPYPFFTDIGVNNGAPDSIITEANPGDLMRFVLGSDDASLLWGSGDTATSSVDLEIFASDSSAKVLTFANSTVDAPIDTGDIISTGPENQSLGTATSLGDHVADGTVNFTISYTPTGGTAISRTLQVVSGANLADALAAFKVAWDADSTLLADFTTEVNTAQTSIIFTTTRFDPNYNITITIAEDSTAFFALDNAVITGTQGGAEGVLIVTRKRDNLVDVELIEGTFPRTGNLDRVFLIRKFGAFNFTSRMFMRANTEVFTIIPPNASSFAVLSNPIGTIVNPTAIEYTLDN